MSETQSYKTFTFRADESASVEVALMMYIKHLDTTAGGDYSDWPNGKRIRDSAQAALTAMMSKA